MNGNYKKKLYVRREMVEEETVAAEKNKCRWLSTCRLCVYALSRIVFRNNILYFVYI